MAEEVLIKDIAKILNSLSWDILTMLSKTEVLSYTEIKKRLNVSQDKASKELTRLEGGLLIRSFRDNVDTRYINFSLTEHGVDILKYRNND